MQQVVLIVDDSLMMHRIIGQILKSGGYKILKADNGEKGYEMAKTHKPNAVIMDVEMPIMNGIESTRLIKSDPETSNIPVVIMTSLASEDDIESCKEAGANCFLNKPISKDDLLKVVREIIA